MLKYFCFSNISLNQRVLNFLLFGATLTIVFTTVTSSGIYDVPFAVVIFDYEKPIVSPQAGFPFQIIFQRSEFDPYPYFNFFNFLRVFTFWGVIGWIFPTFSLIDPDASLLLILRKSRETVQNNQRSFHIRLLNAIFMGSFLTLFSLCYSFKFFCFMSLFPRTVGFPLPYLAADASCIFFVFWKTGFACCLLFWYCIAWFFPILVSQPQTKLYAR